VATDEVAICFQRCLSFAASYNGLVSPSLQATMDLIMLTNNLIRLIKYAVCSYSKSDLEAYGVGFTFIFSIIILRVLGVLSPL
jgi:hypothetical protein